MFSINAESFTSQGTSVDFSNGILTLKNTKGEILSTTAVKAIESYYDKFKFNSGLADDLSDLILTDSFELIKTTGDLYFFVSDITNVENFNGSRIYINEIELFTDLSSSTITTASFFAWQLTIPNESFIGGNLYTFNFWDRRIPVTAGRKVKYIEGNEFTYVPIIGNVGSTFQQGDLVLNGWRDQNTFWKEAEYVSGDGAFFPAWNQIQ